MEDLLVNISPFLGFAVKAYAVFVAVGIFVTIAMLLLALVCIIADWRKKYGKR